MNWLNYHHLYYFKEIAQEGSIANASRKLQTTQSSLSSQLKSLESSFGFQLFLREGRKLVLTNEGNYVLEVANKIFSLGDALISEISNNQLGHGPMSLRVGSVATLSKNIQQLFIGPMIQGATNVEVRSGSTNELYEALNRYEIDFIITDSVNEDKNQSFKNYLIQKFPYCLVSSETHSNEEYLAAIKEKGLIIPRLEAQAKVNLDLFLKRNGLDNSVIKGEVEDTALLRLFAVNENNIVLIPKIGVYRDLIQGKLRILKHVKDFEEVFYLVTRPETFSLLNLDIYISKFREIFQRGDYDN
ncbi:MAG: hypothetical protein CME65_00910 [Halobacteriovoraceae bacterium]|nr:hypothetical protein [Halobacteriovoraceae bacterium]|tara:strand:- start:5817 stop:6719 length:903 start_codon:yes stop_codon:yes gene_type:complete